MANSSNQILSEAQNDDANRQHQKQRRIASVDTLRGLTILLMVFVNDLGPAAPAWMLHIQPPDADGMTLADIVFPFFLFIAGVSIPLAVENARQRGTAIGLQIVHLLTRTLGLLVMGLVGVNLWNGTTMDPQLWGLLSYVAIIFAWCIVPKSPPNSTRIFTVIKIVGAVGLVVLLFVYRREPVPETNVMFRGKVENWTWLQTSWWGILGLIGWAYFVTATLYLLIGKRREWLMAALAMLMLMFVVSRSGGFFTRVDDKPWLEPILPVINGLQYLVSNIGLYLDFGSQLGSLPGIMMAGCVLGTILLPDSDVQTPRERFRWCGIYAAVLFVAGAMMDTFGGINKIAGTPTWGLWCAALATLTWMGLYWLMDVRKVSSWSIVVRPAGANPLIAYLLHPIILFSLGLTGLGASVRAYAGSPSAWVAVGGSLVMALIVCGLTGLIAKAGLRVRI